MEYASRNYIKEYILLWLKIVVLFIVGFIIDYDIAGIEFHFTSYFLPMTIYGMSFLKEHDKFYLFGNSDMVTLFWILKIFLFIFKIIISAIIGMIVFPFINIYYIVNIIKHHILKK